MIFPFIVLFFCHLFIALKEHRSISNIEHVLSRVSNVADDRRQWRKKKKKQIIRSN